MKVYIVEIWVAYEGAELLKIFSDKQKAIDFAKEEGVRNLYKNHRETPDHEIYEIRDEWKGFNVKEFEVN